MQTQRNRQLAVRAWPAILILIAAALPARAGDVPYAGTWGVDAEHCKVAQDQVGAPYIFTKNGYDQHEAHCTFKTVNRDGDAFKFTYGCMVEGDMQSDDTVITISGDTLMWDDGSVAPSLMRCK